MHRITLLVITLNVCCNFGQEICALEAPAYGSSFQEIKTYQEQSLKLGGSKAQLREAQRNTLRAKYGKTGVQRMFQNYSPNPDVEGIHKTLRLAASDNPYQAQGYKRTLLYEKEFTKGGRFRVLATDKTINTRFGKTDVDLFVEDKKTGRRILVEVKENKLSGQNLKDYKLKVRKLSASAYAERRGARVAVLNRYELKPEFKEFAKSRGVQVYDKVTTGKLTSQKSGSMPFRKMQRSLGRKYISASSFKAGGVSGWQTAGKWLGRAGVTLSVGYEAYVVRGYFTSRLSKREFVMAQSQIVGGGLGGWGGAVAGGTIGAYGGPYAWITVPAGMIVGGIIGAFSGAKIGELATAGVYGRLDKKQKEQVTDFIYKYYGVNR